MFIRIIIVSTIYLLALLIVAPIIDHLFTTLDEDIQKKNSNLQILIEVILQLVILCIIWHYVSNFLHYLIIEKINLKIKTPSKDSIGIIVSIAFVGLQKNLLDKINYLTFKHPFRLSDIYLF